MSLACPPQPAGIVVRQVGDGSYDRVRGIDGCGGIRALPKVDEMLRRHARPSNMTTPQVHSHSIEIRRGVGDRVTFLPAFQEPDERFLGDLLCVLTITGHHPESPEQRFSMFLEKASNGPNSSSKDRSSSSVCVSSMTSIDALCVSDRLPTSVPEEAPDHPVREQEQVSADVRTARA